MSRQIEIKPTQKAIRHLMHYWAKKHGEMASVPMELARNVTHFTLQAGFDQRGIEKMADAWAKQFGTAWNGGPGGEDAAEGDKR